MEAAKNAGQPLTGRFRLGVIPTIAPFLLPGVLPLLRTRFPKLRLFLREDLTQRLIAQLKAGRLDAALIALPFDMAGLEWAHIRDDELLAAVPADHPLAKLASTTSEAMELETLILLEDGHCLREHVLSACRLNPPRAAAGEEPFAATSLPTLVQMVGGPGRDLPAADGRQRRSGRGRQRRRPPHRGRPARPRDRRRLARRLQPPRRGPAAGRGAQGGLASLSQDTFRYSRKNRLRPIPISIYLQNRHI